ncbi:spore coat U domain-containing protein [Candidatus Pantoea formicae]|uniref:Csu type fimbrial protein n=1 Tax=Candidatus Pantoea formicae TaxID=2608355 RepID=UPI003EDA4CCA
MKRMLMALVVLLSGWSGTLWAACTGSSSSTALGSISSFTLASTAQVVETGTGFTCSGSALSLLSTNTVTGTISSSANASGTTPRFYNSSTGSYVPYSICSDSACSTVYNIGSSKTWSSTSLLGLLGLFNASDGSLPLYLKTTTGVNVPAGTYTDTLTLSWNYSICFVGVLGLCVYTTGTATSTIQLQFEVTNDCAIDSAPDVDFGSASLPASFSAVSSTLAVRCTLNAAYSINLASSHASSGDWRQMSNGDSLLQYQLYQSDGTAWTASNNLSETGTGAAQSINYSAKINPDQTNQPAGSYSDTVTVTVTY